MQRLDKQLFPVKKINMKSHIINKSAPVTEVTEKAKALMKRLLKI
jgi:hypothetical protein